jgi:hypothetical protein
MYWKTPRREERAGITLKRKDCRKEESDWKLLSIYPHKRETIL